MKAIAIFGLAVLVQSPPCLPLRTGAALDPVPGVNYVERTKLKGSIVVTDTLDDLEQWCLAKVKGLMNELSLLKSGVNHTFRQDDGQMVDTTEATIKSYEVAIGDMKNVVAQIRNSYEPKV